MHAMSLGAAFSKAHRAAQLSQLSDPQRRYAPAGRNANLCPGKLLAKGSGIDHCEDTFEGVLRRNAPGKFQEPFEPVGMRGAKVHDLSPGIAIGYDTAKGNGNDVDQAMFGALAYPRVFEASEVFFDGGDARGSDHAILRNEGEIRRDRTPVHLSKSTLPR